MPVIFFLTLFVGAISLMSFQLFLFNTALSITVGIVQCATFILSMIVVIRMFRRRNNRFQAGFYAMGALISVTVPAIIYLPFGIIRMFTDAVLVLYIGWSAAFLIFLGILYGMLRGRWNWKVRRETLVFDNLPADLNNLKIVQFSDVHVGSFFNQYDRVQKAIDMINELEPDYILFTGDLVNNLASEMNGWEPVFRQLKAKRGKYSILGNHDYADYMQWPDNAQKQQNLQALIQMHREIGFTPLLNEHVQLSSEGNGAYLIGVENWGTGGFRKSGDLEKATAGVPENSFRILLSHDPSHFDAEVVGTGIDLTLSGHTHGMQFGIERFGIRFSPVQFRYKKWAGLYRTGKQFLYVNRGFGYIGFPGRVGIYPEITEIILMNNVQ